MFVKGQSSAERTREKWLLKSEQVRQPVEASIPQTPAQHRALSLLVAPSEVRTEGQNPPFVIGRE